MEVGDPNRLGGVAFEGCQEAPDDDEFRLPAGGAGLPEQLAAVDGDLIGAFDRVGRGLSH